MPSFRIRPADSGDALGMASVRVNTWRVAYRGIVPDAFLDGLSAEGVADRWSKAFWQDRDPGVGLFVAENEAGEIIGIAICGPEQDRAPAHKGEIYVLYVLPAYQQRGIGRSLVAACARHLIGQLGAKTLIVWVIAENPYRRFYESLGGKLVREKTMEIGGKPILEAGYGWDELDSLQYL